MTINDLTVFLFVTLPLPHSYIPIFLLFLFFPSLFSEFNDFFWLFVLLSLLSLSFVSLSTFSVFTSLSIHPSPPVTIIIYLPLSFTPLPPFLPLSLQGTVSVTSMLSIPQALFVDGGLYFCEAHNNMTILSNTVQSKQAEISVISRHCGRKGERLRRMERGKEGWREFEMEG